jgi:membrane carboxypeptidase/penicillin-binding protein PbpC
VLVVAARHLADLVAGVHDRRELVNAAILAPGAEADGRAEEAGMSLRAHTRREGALFWFADEAFLGRSAPGQDLRWRPPGAGRYTLAAVDSEGASSTREVVVEFTP